MARVGEKLGRYELTEQLGKGAAGTVFRARDSLLGIDVCVKILHSGLATQPGIIERFKRELLLARRIAHPGICKIFDIQEANGTHFLTMEYVQGETLSTLLNRDGQMPPLNAVRLMRKVSEALGAAHKAGVVHRDIKPGNIIIGDDGRITIVDFGVATAEDLDRLTRAGVVLGSRSYMAPETWQGKPATAAGDVWALGVILYGCVTGRLPYKGEGVVGVFDAIKNTKPLPPSALSSDVTPELEELIFKAMCVDVSQRYPDASAVEHALATLELDLSAGDDDASTVVRPPAFASGSNTPGSSGSSPARASGAAPGSASPSSARPGSALRGNALADSALPDSALPDSAAPPSSAADATRDLSKNAYAHARELPSPPAAPSSERLHRPSALPRPPPAMSPAAPAPAATFPAKGTEEISLIGDEMSLYSPGDASALGAARGSAERSAESALQEATRVVPPPESSLPAQNTPSAESVADAFDAAFGLASGDPMGSPPHTHPGPDAGEPATVIATVPPDFGPPDESLQGMNVLLGQNVRSGSSESGAPPSVLGALDGPAFAPESSGDGWEVRASSGAALDFVTAPSVQSQGAASLYAEGPALESAAADAFVVDDQTQLNDQSLSLTALTPEPASDDGFFSAPPAESTRIEPYAALPDEQGQAAGLDRADGMPRRPDRSSDDLLAVRKGPDKRALFAAAAAVVLVVVIAAAVLGGSDEESAVASDAAPAAAAGATGEGAEAWVFPDENTAKAANADAPPDEPVAQDPAAAVAAAKEIAAEEGAVAANHAPDADDGTAEAADDTANDTANVTADDGEASALASADAPSEGEQAGADEGLEEQQPDEREPAAEVMKPRKQRSAAQAARSKYKRKRSALNSALAKKGVLPGDASAVDQKRRAMTSAARRGDYGRAADAADDALREVAKVKVDAAFVGNKLARFNRGYDKTTDDALRTKLKGVLKEVGTAYSKGRYDDANQKLNRAFALMRR